MENDVFQLYKRTYIGGIEMICKNCGHENDDRRRYCEKCGEYLYPEEDVMETTKVHKKVETVVKTDKKKVFHYVMIGMIVTLLVVGGSSIYFMNQLRVSKNAEIAALEKKNQKLTKQVKKLKKEQSKSDTSYDKEIAKLNKENKEQAQKIVELQDQLADLGQDTDSSKKKSSSSE